jgi:hypothetical protein
MKKIALIGTAALVVDVVFGNGMARATPVGIEITISSSGLPSITVPLILGSSTPTMAVVDLTTLNSELNLHGYLINFSSLGGTSTFPGTAQSAGLTLTGTVSVPDGTFTITETEGSFTAPTGGATLTSVVGGSFLPGIGNSQTSQSSLNTTTLTPLFTLTAPGSGMTTIPVLIPPVPFTLDNEVTINLATGEDTFGVSASLNKAPLPAALPLFATGIGGLGLLGWRRKRKAQAGA